MALCLSAAVLLGAPASAEAGWRLDRAKTIGEIVLQDPCGGDVTVAWAELPAGVTAQARSVCPGRVVLSSTEPLDWMGFCSYVLHEYGLLANFVDYSNEGPGWQDLSHSSNEDSVMSAFFNDDRRCRKRGRPCLEQHGVLAPRSARVPCQCSGANSSSSTGQLGADSA